MLPGWFDTHYARVWFSFEMFENPRKILVALCPILLHDGGAVRFRDCNAELSKNAGAFKFIGFVICSGGGSFLQRGSPTPTSLASAARTAFS